MSFAQDIQIGKFPEIDQIQSKLERGVSTKQDVEAILGKPAGYGGYLAIMDRKPREVWYYHDQNSSIINTKGNVIRMHSHMQMLMVFFFNEKLDGYKWFSNASAAKGKVLGVAGEIMSEQERQ